MMISELERLWKEAVVA